MAVTAAREESYIRAIMMLGAKPREPKRIGPGSAARSVPAEVDAYKAAMTYNDEVQKYFLKHVFQGVTSALGNTDDWIEGFYAWQGEYVIEIECGLEYDMTLMPRRQLC